MESFQVGFCGVLLSAASVLACEGNAPLNRGNQNGFQQPGAFTDDGISFNGQPNGLQVNGPRRFGRFNGRKRRNVEDSPTKEVLSETSKISTKEERRDGHSNNDHDEQKHGPSPEKTSHRKPQEGVGPKGMPRPELNGEENRHNGERNSWGKKDNPGNDRSEKTVTDKKDKITNFNSRTRRSIKDLKNMKEQKSKDSCETKEKEQYKEDKSDKMTESKSQVVKDSEKHDTSKSCSENKSVEETHHEDCPEEDCKKDDDKKECSECCDECCDCKECCSCKKKREHHDEKSCSDRNYKKCD